MFDQEPPLADKILQTAREILHSREVVHGEKHLNVSNIARFWNAFLETRNNVNAPLSKFEVCLLMTLLKVARTQSGTNNADDLLDAIGYLAMAHEMRP
jgi:hypothetical protein